MNRTWGKIELFADEGDYAAFERVLAAALQREPGMRLCSYCLMPNHFHLVLWPKDDGILSRFMQWMTMTHTQRWHAHRGTGGRGHLYQSRFKSFPIQQDEHFLSVGRYVERNALRANLVQRAEDWRWCSLQVRQNGYRPMIDHLAAWPVDVPRKWTEIVNEPQDENELAALRLSRDRGRPFGSPAWTAASAKRLGITSSMRPAGRPKKSTSKVAAAVEHDL
jgi:putative transposase